MYSYYVQAIYSHSFFHHTDDRNLKELQQEYEKQYVFIEV